MNSKHITDDPKRSIMLYTHNLENNHVMRASVLRASVAGIGARHLVLATSTVLSAKQKISSADPAMFNRQQEARLGCPVAGCMRLDVVSDTILKFIKRNSSDEQS